MNLVARESLVVSLLRMLRSLPLRWKKTWAYTATVPNSKMKIQR